MEIKSNLVVGISKKTGNEYVRVDIQLTPTYKTSVFLKPAECELVKIYYQNERSKA